MKKGIIAGMVFVSIIVVLGICLISFNNKNNKPTENNNTINNAVAQNNFKSFNSLKEIEDFINKSAEYEIADSFGLTSVSSARSKSGAATTSAPMAAEMQNSGTSAGASGSSDYSKTNIQVEGVDEADIVKNDGKYIYTVSGNKVIIVNAYPAESMKIVSEINISDAIGNIFLNKDKLIIFSNEYKTYQSDDQPTPISSDGRMAVMPYRIRYSTPLTRIYIFDVTKRESPVLEKNISVSGTYTDSRMIGDYVYLISSKWINRGDGPLLLPSYSVDGFETAITPNNIKYFDYEDSNYVFNSISALNLDNNFFKTEVYLTGSASTIYVSEKNIYLTYTKRINYYTKQERMIKEVVMPLLPEEEKNKVESIMNSDKPMYEKDQQVSDLLASYSDSLQGNEKSEFAKKLLNETDNFEFRIQKESEKTVIHKIAIDKSNIEYKTAGEVNGHVLNQFSMDEFNGNFRIATTTGEVFSGSSLNHLFVLNSNMRIIGGIEDLAPGEKIYSARFIGNKGYIVTFKKVDPLFVIDLSKPESPKVLGYLKIPGYSDYLHPYDENHVIGIGKEAIDASESEVAGRNLDFAWYQGVKIALFDITDVEHPVEKAKIVIGDRGTDSEALNDHKAFLFNKEKNLLVIPINLAVIDRSKYEGKTCQSEYDSNCLSAHTYGEQVWQGAYVLNVSLDGISIRGKVTHDEKRNNQGYYDSWGSNVRRSLYISNVLYTISNKKIKANALDTVNDISSVQLAKETPYPIYEEAVY